VLHEHSAAIDEAIAARKFPESRRGHYERLMTRDPEGTRRLIASLQTPLTPLSERPRQATIRSDAGRRIVATAQGGYAVANEPSSLDASSSSSIPTAPPKSKSGVIRHKSTFSIPLSESDEPVSGADYLKGNGPPTLEGRAAALTTTADAATGTLPAAWFPQYRDEPRVQNRD
jgi:hypothetical protein